MPSRGPSIRKSIQACELIKKIKIPEVINFDLNAIGAEPVQVGEYPHQVGEKFLTEEESL